MTHTKLFLSLLELLRLKVEGAKLKVHVGLARARVFAIWQAAENDPGTLQAFPPNLHQRSVILLLPFLSFITLSSAVVLATVILIVVIVTIIIIVVVVIAGVVIVICSALLLLGRWSCGC